MSGGVSVVVFGSPPVPSSGVTFSCSECEALIALALKY
jgi:hypothetical protein